MNEQSIFTFFSFRSKRLSILSRRFLKITEREDAVINLTNSFTVKLHDVLMISGIATNLLLIQALITQEITNQQDIDKYKFFKDDEIIAKDKQHGKTSFLS